MPNARSRLTDTHEMIQFEKFWLAVYPPHETYWPNWVNMFYGASCFCNGGEIICSPDCHHA
jgi:hypothetical protein